MPLLPFLVRPGSQLSSYSEAPRTPKWGAYEVRPTRTMGKGLFAAKDLAPGSIILTETALLSLPTAAGDRLKNHPARRFLEALQALPAPQQAEFDRLHHTPQDLARVEADAGTQERVLHWCRTTLRDAPAPDEAVAQASRRYAAFFTNRAETYTPAPAGGRQPTTAGGGGVMPPAATGSAVFLLLSRINHSCVPNARWWYISHQPGRQRIGVRAVRAVAAGEQIFISYLADAADVPREERQASLSKNWGFRCKCEACQG